MPKAHISLCFIIFLCVSFEIFMSVNSQSHGDWCIANSITDNDKLIKNIDFACSKIDCGIILEGGSCYDPNTPLNHASVAMNLYYQAQGRHLRDCYFDGSGLITIIDPSDHISHEDVQIYNAWPDMRWSDIFNVLDDGMVDSDGKSEGSEDEVYKQVRQIREAKRAAKANSIQDRHMYCVHLIDMIVSFQGTIIDLVITRNRGWKRLISNERIDSTSQQGQKEPEKELQGKNKYMDKVKRRGGQVREIRKPSGSYGGEVSESLNVSVYGKQELQKSFQTSSKIKYA
ncbi:hypothetical protein YC2023_047748 [Brassica napus]